MTQVEPNDNCPCGSRVTFAACCQRIHRDAKLAHQPEQIMRARYSAFITGEIDFLIHTSHPDLRTLELREQLTTAVADTHWLGLEVLARRVGAQEGQVEFVAFYRTDKGVGQLHENSTFHTIDGRWLYHSGEFLPPIKLQRNQPCICGSQRKYKRCCGR